MNDTKKPDSETTAKWIEQTLMTQSRYLHNPLTDNERRLIRDVFELLERKSQVNEDYSKYIEQTLTRVDSNSDFSEPIKEVINTVLSGNNTEKLQSDLANHEWDKSEWISMPPTELQKNLAIAVKALEDLRALPDVDAGNHKRIADAALKQIGK